MKTNWTFGLISLLLIVAYSWYSCRSGDSEIDTEAFVDSMANDVLVEVSDTAMMNPDLGQAVSQETRTMMVKEKAELKEKIRKKVEESKMKDQSCEEILVDYTRIMEDCVIRNRCSALENWDFRDIRFKQCREKVLQRQFDLLEIRMDSLESRMEKN